MKPDLYLLAKAGLGQAEMEEIFQCDDRERQIKLLRKCRCRLLEQIHEKQQTLDELDYAIRKMREEKPT